MRRVPSLTSVALLGFLTLPSLSLWVFPPLGLSTAAFAAAATTRSVSSTIDGIPDSQGDSFLIDCLSDPDITAITHDLAPPAEGSPEDVRDLQEVEARHQNHTVAECERAVRAKDISAEATGVFFGGTGLLTPAEVKTTDRFLTQSYKAMDRAVWGLKNSFKRKRPFERHAELRSCEPVGVAGTSYPSGHAAISRLEALVLSEIYPERREAFLKRADEIAADRVLLGVHHPSDVKAGALIADRTFDRIKACPKFQDVLSSLRGLARVPAHLHLQPLKHPRPQYIPDPR